MTVAVDAVGKELYAATRPPWKRGSADDEWEAMTPGQKYQRRAAAGEVVLPVLVALPDRPTVGAPPHFSDEEYAEAAVAGARALVGSRDPDAWESLSAKKQQALLQTTVALTRAAVAAMPVRQDPDAITVPDHL